MNQLSILDHGFSIANSAVGIFQQISAYTNISDSRKASNILMYSLGTMQDARYIIDNGNFSERDAQRAEALLDAFTIGTYEKIYKTSKR